MLDWQWHFLSFQSTCRLKMASSCLRELYNTSLVLWHSAVHSRKTESDEDLPTTNKTSGLPDPTAGTTCDVFHSLFLTLFPHQRPAETMRRQDIIQTRNTFLYSALVRPMPNSAYATETGWHFCCDGREKVWMVQLCFLHHSQVQQISELYLFPAAVAMLCNTAALTPNDHSWCIPLSWTGERQSKWQVISMQLLRRTHGDYYEGAGKTSLESACGADNWAIAFFDNF